MEFAEFCDLCRRLESTPGRLEKVALTANFLSRLAPEEIPWTVAFLTGRPFPASDPRVLELSWAALASVPVVAPNAQSRLALLDVAAGFAEIAAATGKGSRQAKIARLAQLLGRATSDEQPILRRILHGEMRIGVHDGLVEEAIAKASAASPAAVRRAALLLSDLAEVARIALTQGPEGLGQVGVALFVPLLPMLSELTDDFSEILAAHHGRTALEFKYDGARIQIHRRADLVRIWSRRLTEVTASLPDIVQIARALNGETFILDGEVVAVGSTGRPLPFQELMRRFRRVHKIEALVKEVPLALYLFDCLYRDGRSLIDEPYEQRWSALREITRGAYLAKSTMITDESAGREFLQAALAEGHEGVMAKDPASPYLPGNRGKRWFKLKSAVTIDCVIVAADRGSGRRRGWLSNYHLAVIDGHGGFAPVGKTFKGLTDQEFTEITARLRALEVADDGYTVTVRPEIVVEVTYNEIQKSPQYSSGFALRFARITRIRDDKSPDQATTLKELRDLYERQFLSKGRLEL
ncbi:MAG TPA: ATP-dependent DNA ligase [Candidatus Acidoferrales bacterium]|nr:ATP-dependent DNA ligase [Candidatus Acidoferrales bacterium]